MADDRDNDNVHLLRRTGAIQSQASYQDEFEMQNASRSMKKAYSSQTYSSLWDHDVEGHDDGLPPYKDLKSSSTRVSTIGSVKPAMKNIFERSARFVLRSGRYASHVSYESASGSGKMISSKYSGWRGGVLAACCSAGLVLFVNLVFAIFGLVVSKSGTKVGTLMSGECGKVGNIDTWMHIIINIAGTFLLGASNFTMQCISSPTRTEIDAAHARGTYRDIGLPSLRNLSGWRKKTLYGLLVLSTLPLHFFWNSAVFTKTQLLDYNVFVVQPTIFSSPLVDCNQNVSKAFTKMKGALQPSSDYKNFPLDNGVHIIVPSNHTIPTFNGTRWVNQTMTVLTDMRGSSRWYQRNTCDEANTMLTKANTSKLVRMSNKECITNYGVARARFSKWGSVFLVTKPGVQAASGNATNLSMLLQFRYQSYVSNYTGNNWVCGPEHLLDNNYQCDYRSIAGSSSNWTIGEISPDSNKLYTFGIARTTEWPIDYCLAEQTNLGGECQLQYSFVIMACVVAANLVKLFCMVTVLRTQHEPVLATIGDGIASFLEKPDKPTAKTPFLTRNEARRYRDHPRSTLLSTEATLRGKPRQWKSPKHALRWWKAPSWIRLSITVFLCTAACCTAFGLLSDCYNRSKSSASYEGISPWAMGFGSYNSFATLPGWGGEESTEGNIDSDSFSSSSILLTLVATANIPQVIVSCLYFAYNTVYTSMVSADEWSRFTTHQKALRTTMPRGQQRSTYWLSLPWTYALPLSAASATLHYLISQSLFIARTEILDTMGEPEPVSFMQLAYSPLAWLIAALFGSMMVLSMILNGFRKLRPCVLVGNNSLAIASACHNVEGDEGAELRKVGWGAVTHEQDGKPGHCSFTSREVERPIEGGLYI